jgi:membrane protein
VQNARAWEKSLRRFLGRDAWDVIARVWGRVQQYELFTRAAAVSFYAIAALVPLLGLILIIAARLLPDLTGFYPGAEGVGDLTVEGLRETVRATFPAEAAGVIEREIARLQAVPPTSLISFGLAITLWLSSSLFLAIIDAMNRVLEVDETRGFWRLRLTAVALTIVQSLIVVGSLAVIVLWPQILSGLGFDAPAAAVATVVQWLLVFLMLALSFAIALRFAPAGRRRWAWFTPGSIFGTVATILACVGFRYYAQNWGSYNATYGSLGGAIVLLAWMWVVSFVFLAAVAIDEVIADRRDRGEAAPIREGNAPVTP